MAKGITYSVTDSHGHTHTRYSARHTAPIYTHVTVRLFPNRKADKHEVAYASRLDLAQALASQTRKHGLAVEILPVTTKPGR